jgi:hypothetical protein
MSTTTTHAASGAGEGESPTDLAARFEAKREGFVPDHEFKSHPSVFWPAARGEKTFEYRRDDRGGYEVGQTVRLRCYLPLSGAYIDTPPLDRRITNILRGGEFELPKGFCILSLAPAFAEARDMARADAAGRAGERVRHVKRGTEYEVLGEAELQIATRNVFEEDRLVVYRSVADGKIWAREASEFRDGRFETIAAAPPPPAQQGSSSPPLTAERVDLGELKRLSAAATQGVWMHKPFITGNGAEFWEDRELTIDGVEEFSSSLSLADAGFIVALVNAYRSGHLVPASLPAGTGSVEEGTGLGATPMGSGSHPSDRTPSGSAGFAVSILRAELLAKAEEQVRYWRERQSHETCPEDQIDDDGNYTPMGDDAAIRFGHCNGRYSEADWWLKTISNLDLSVRDRSGEAGETTGSPEGKSPAPSGATPTPDPVGEAKALLEGLDLNDGIPEQQIGVLRNAAARLPSLSPEAAVFRTHADRIEAALATLHASQDQAGEVRRG